MEFQSWSKVNSEAQKALRPQIEKISWDGLTEEDKNKIWQYLYRKYFFDKTPRYPEYLTASGNAEKAYHFEGHGQIQEVKRFRIFWTVHELNIRFKKESFGKNTLENPTYFNGCSDFFSIFMKMPGHVVLEMLSIYCEGLLYIKRDSEYRYGNETDEDFISRIKQLRIDEFDQFADDINEVFSQFDLDIFLTRQGFMPVQEKIIIEQIYKPVLTFFSNTEWQEVNNLIASAFREYEKKTPDSLRFCITTTVSAVQAFLQIMVHGKTGKGDISELIKDAQNSGKIPSDTFSLTIFRNINTVFARERQDKSIAHPPQEIATEKTALLMLNLAMVFFQHCIVV